MLGQTLDRHIKQPLARKDIIQQPLARKDIIQQPLARKDIIQQPLARKDIIHFEIQTHETTCFGFPVGLMVSVFFFKLLLNFASLF